MSNIVKNDADEIVEVFIGEMINVKPVGIPEEYNDTITVMLCDAAYLIASQDEETIKASLRHAPGVALVITRLAAATTTLGQGIVPICNLPVFFNNYVSATGIIWGTVPVDKPSEEDLVQIEKEVLEAAEILRNNCKKIIDEEFEYTPEVIDVIRAIVDDYTDHVLDEATAQGIITPEEHAAALAGTFDKTVEEHQQAVDEAMQGVSDLSEGFVSEATKLVTKAKEQVTEMIEELSPTTTGSNSGSADTSTMKYVLGAVAVAGVAYLGYKIFSDVPNDTVIIDTDNI